MKRFKTPNSKWVFVIYSFFSREKPGQRIWIDATFGGDWFVFIWWKKNRPVLYRSPDATPPDRDGKPGKFIFGSSFDLLP